MSEPTYDPSAPVIGRLSLELVLAGEYHDYEYTISKGPWEFREFLCFVELGDSVSSKIPRSNIVRFRFYPTGEGTLNGVPRVPIFPVSAGV